MVRTRGTNLSNPVIISDYTVLPAMRKPLFGLIALLVLSVSVPTAFESAYADGEDPIKMVLDITYQNILELREDAGVISENADTFFAAGQEKYNEALSALEAGDWHGGNTYNIRINSSEAVVLNPGIPYLDPLNINQATGLRDLSCGCSLSPSSFLEAGC